MRIRLTPRLGACCFALASLLVGGCATTPGGSSSNSGPAYVAHRTTILIETTNVVGPSGEIFVNGVSQGFTPVRLVSDTDEFGNILEDLEIIARWDDGRNESYYRLNRGSRPDPIIRFSPSSSGRDY